MRVFELENILNKKLDITIAEEWDNVGLLIGNKNEEVTSIYLTLEVSNEALEEARSKGCNFIIAHHPIMFSGMKKITSDDTLVYNALKYGINIYASHTNFDKIENGLNDYFVNKVSFKKSSSQINEYLRVFEIEDISTKNFIEKIKSDFGVKYTRFIGDLNKKIRKVGVVTGAGYEFAKDAKEADADLFITGDIKYHQAMEFFENKFNVLDMGHFETEAIFADAMEKFIKDNIQEINIPIVKSKKEVNPYKFI